MQSLGSIQEELHPGDNENRTDGDRQLLGAIRSLDNTLQRSIVDLASAGPSHPLANGSPVGISLGGSVANTSGIDFSQPQVRRRRLTSVRQNSEIGRKDKVRQVL